MVKVKKRPEILFPFLFLLLVFILGSKLACKKEDHSAHQAEASASAEEHAAHQLQKQKAPEHQHEESQKQPEKKILYQCPMHPEYTSDKPGNCPICGMTLVPVKEKESEEKMAEMPEGTVRISPEKQQLIGVTFGTVEFLSLEKKIRAAARVTYDESRIKDVNTKFSGWVEKLDVDFTGKLVRKGEPLFSIYSPELVSAQEEYLLALRAQGLESVLESARNRLILWDLTEEQIKELENSHKAFKTMIFYAPFTGFVIEKNIVQGKFVMAGESLYKIADISSVWLLADIYEQDVSFVSLGQQVSVELPFFPGESFSGKISYLYPYLENMTRTVKARIALSNGDFRLKPEMFGHVEIKFPVGKKLALPESAVLDSGTRKIVFVDKGDGYLEPREVRLGRRADDYFEVVEGVHEGERVVTSANFLIDSESKLKSALQKTHKH